MYAENCGSGMSKMMARHDFPTVRWSLAVASEQRCTAAGCCILRNVPMHVRHVYAAGGTSENDLGATLFLSVADLVAAVSPRAWVIRANRQIASVRLPIFSGLRRNRGPVNPAIVSERRLKTGVPAVSCISTAAAAPTDTAARRPAVPPLIVVSTTVGGALDVSLLTSAPFLSPLTIARAVAHPPFRRVTLTRICGESA